ncbi:MAG: hypothetical protein DMD91_17165 [Candidatus Rokuibacteriota bacterium]|nr:MAG: hypothetical protein DMD91_17165 [Candidatus Rokubacteria bacterium]
MARVLILTASYGSGHNAAARSLTAAFEQAGAVVTVVDHFRELVHPTFDRLSRTLYHWVLRRAPHAWGAGYALGDRLAPDSPLAFGVPRLGASRLRRLLDTLRPDAVVTVHATPAIAMATLAAEGHRLPPHTTVVTDFVAHRQWMARPIDRYCVAAHEVKDQLVARGTAPERIVVTGVPVRPEFEDPVDPVAARVALGLSTRVPVVLVMAGAQGTFGRLPDVASALARVSTPFEGVIVAGEDERVGAEVRRRARGTSIRTLGYVKDIRGLMAAADLLVTKAGGMTLAEALAAELPLVAFASLPGQERRNERFASKHGVALIARSRRELARTVERALGDPALRERLRERMRALRRPDASRRIVGLVLEQSVRAR